VAKAAVSSYLGQKNLFPSAIEITTSPSNEPLVSLRANHSLEVPKISISHRDDCAVAVASDRNRVGIDVEILAVEIAEIADQFSQPSEEKEVKKCFAWNQIQILTAIWAVKESARKALGAETLSMHELEIRHPRKDGEYLVCEFSSPQGDRVRSVAFQSRKYVYSVSCGLE
jgi:phosphopantetheinyl transferase